MTRWQVFKLLFTWDLAAKLAEYSPPSTLTETAPEPTAPAPQRRFKYDHISSRMR